MYTCRRQGPPPALERT